MRRALLAISCLLVLAGQPYGPVESAEACSTIALPFRVPRAVLPGNLIRIEVLETGPLVQFTLLNAESGATIPSSVLSLGSDRVLVPDAPVAAGQRIVVLASRSKGAVSARSVPESELLRHEFTTAEHAALALREPKLTLIEHRGASARYRYTSPDTTGNLAGLIDVDVRVGDGTVTPIEYIGAGRYEFELRTSCDGTATEDSCGRIHTFSEGEQEVKVHAHVLGQNDQPETLTDQVVLSCGEGCAVTGSRTNAALLTLLPLLLLTLQRRRRTARAARGRTQARASY